MQSKGLSERRALKVVRMSASSLRYEPRPDQNVALRQSIVELAQRHRRYGSEMIYLKLRQAGEQVNHKRVERLYTQEGLQVRKRQRKKIPVSERQPLIRPGAANEVWSMDFVFDRVSSGWSIKCLAIVDDATHEAIAIVPEHSIGGERLTRLLDEICAQRGKPAIIRTDNGREFTNHAEMAKGLVADIYFARPYHSWERGLNENSNGLLRQYFPKSQELESVDSAKLRDALCRMNHRPKKILGFKTPYEVFFGESIRYADAVKVAFQT
jgi:IS30 family transposase